jgi:hypothetical protein
MAHYLVKARYVQEMLVELRRRLDSGEIHQMRPFGTALQYSLDHARLDPQGDRWAVWEEEDYCRPPLAQERTAVLDTYFKELSVESVKEGQGWTRIESLPRLWDKADGGQDEI